MNDESESPDGRSMLEKMTGAFLLPFPRKPTGKAKGKGNPSRVRSPGRSGKMGKAGTHKKNMGGGFY